MHGAAKPILHQIKCKHRIDTTSTAPLHPAHPLASEEAPQQCRLASPPRTSRRPKTRQEPKRDTHFSTLKNARFSLYTSTKLVSHTISGVQPASAVEGPEGGVSDRLIVIG